MKGKWRWEKRETSSKTVTILVPIFSCVVGLLFAGIFIWVSGKNPLLVYGLMVEGALGSAYGISETVVKAIPLMLTGLAVSLAFRMQLWNIGAEGQFYMGAFGATWAALTFPDWPAYLLLPTMLMLGFVAGGIWGLLPAIPRAYFKVNETITTLLMNYIAILWVDYFVFGPWKDPKGMNFPLTAPFSEGALLPAFGTSRIHVGLILALLIAAIFYYVLQYTKWGFEIRVSGESPRAAHYAGMNHKRNILLVMLISGGIAGIAGMTEVSAITQRLQHGISPGYGYTAIIIAWLARLHPLAIVFVSFLFGGLLVGGFSIQTSGFPAATVAMLQGAILFFVVGGEIFTQYRLTWGGKGER
ncbi:ABC transporter permease [Heliophilum fasciatum]|uniref:Nucleoside ABC transporter membrane protein n=1 Tax=Heliophilum fasciatum TaxID=35700 RepID=A0A4R2RP72_9FIRM|nr:ABC transporter permease [Heliophilum fasciatum]MCW2279196.1 simple sugar transport system permease protein [Heliophilum fasciatum]TCP60985.1 nucleoside ABC transporter membrane protein [Heliophilum fasciatum]